MNTINLLNSLTYLEIVVISYKFKVYRTKEAGLSCKLYSPKNEHTERKVRRVSAGPKLRWTVCHIRELLPTKQVGRGTGSPIWPACCTIGCFLFSTDVRDISGGIKCLRIVNLNA